RAVARHADGGVRGEVEDRDVVLALGKEPGGPARVAQAAEGVGAFRAQPEVAHPFPRLAPRPRAVPARHRRIHPVRQPAIDHPYPERPPPSAPRVASFFLFAVQVLELLVAALDEEVLAYPVVLVPAGHGPARGALLPFFPVHFPPLEPGIDLLRAT